MKEEYVDNENKAFSSAYITDKLLKIGVVLLVLYLVSLKDYLLFHSLIELIGASISAAIFLLAWNSRKFTKDNTYVFIGSAFLVSSFLSIIHALAYKGMTVFPGTATDANLGTQLWLANQYILAASFVVAPFLLDKRPRRRIFLPIFGIYLIFILLSIFWWKNFPVAYVEGYGLTKFKDFSEYFVAILFLISAYLFFEKRKNMDSKVPQLFSLVAILLSVSTIFFTEYVGVYSTFNMIGHLVRLAAFYPAYLGIFEFGLMKPYHYLFKNLKQGEDELRKNERRLRDVIESQSELVCRFLPDGTLTLVNDAYCRYYGKSKDALLGKQYFENIPDEIMKEDKKRLASLTPGNPVLQVEHRAIDKNGWHRWQHWTTRAVFGPEEELIEFQSVGRDITEQKYMEEALRKSEEKFRTLIDNSLVGVYRANIDGNYIYVNEAMAKMFEFSSGEEMIKENAKIRYVRAEDREIFLNILKEKGSISNYELTGITNLGKQINILSSATLFGDEISGMIINITKRKRAEKALEKAAEEWTMTFNSISDAIFILDPQHTIKKANKALLELLGKKKEEIIGKKCYEVVHKLHHPWKICPLVITRETGQPHTEEVDDKSLGKVLLVTTSPILDNAGKIVGIAHVAKDITQRKKTEKKIADLAKFPKENPNPVLRVDIRGTITYANPASRKLLAHWNTKVGLSVPEKWLHIVQVSLREQGKKEMLDEYGGRIFSILIMPVSKAGYANLYAIDITDAKNLEKSKDEFISLASHQLRTPLSSIGLSAELLLRGVAGELAMEQKEYLREIHKSVKKMSLLASNLLNVSRVEMGSFEVRSEPLDLSVAISAHLKEFAPLTAEKKLDMEANIGDNIPIIQFDEKSFGIIFDNILSNAIRYTPVGGKISVGIKENGSGVQLKVSDSGCGIPDDQKDNIFTKSFRAENAKVISSEGAGLGLYMARIAAEKSGAKIWFESEERKGTTFFVLFSK